MQTEAQLVALMQQGIANRKVAATGGNAQSSRSHCLVLLAVERLLPDGSCARGKLCLVDLAGQKGPCGALCRAAQVVLVLWHGVRSALAYACMGSAHACNRRAPYDIRHAYKLLQLAYI